MRDRRQPPALTRRGLVSGAARDGERRRPWSAARRHERVSAMAPPHRGGSSKSVPAPPGAAVIAYNRAAFGPRPGDLAAFAALPGGSDAARLAAWVDQQLDPLAIDDSALDARLATSGFTTLAKSLAQLWTDHVAGDPPWEQRMRPYWETELATFVRAVHSHRQLLEVLADFWHNHFSVSADDYWIGPVFVHYDRDVIRANALGNFRTLLEAVASSTAMLRYLDNYTSSDDGPNENYARELLELHTMGAMNYLGVMRQMDVPRDGQGRPVGYVDDDVYEATRAFTGWTHSTTTGLFSYNADGHDRFQKTVLGRYMAADQPALRDGRDVLDVLAEHPGTARHVATKLARRLLADEPPPAVVDAAAAVFAAQVAAPDQLAQVVRTILLHPAFLTTWGEKLKRPFELVVSALRAAEVELPFILDDDLTNNFFWRYDETGQPLFRWRAPTGYPDLREDWQSASSRVGAWRLLGWLADAEDGGHPVVDAVAATPAGVRSAAALADYWVDRLLGRPMPAAERTEIVDFMAQGHNPGHDLPLDSDGATQERLRAMVVLILMSPSFAWR